MSSKAWKTKRLPGVLALGLVLDHIAYSQPRLGVQHHSTTNASRLSLSTNSLCRKDKPSHETRIFTDWRRSTAFFVL